jgi:hypothetical protein
MKRKDNQPVDIESDLLSSEIFNDLMQNNNFEVSTLVAETKSILPKPESMDFTKIKVITDDKSNVIIDSILEFYIDKEQSETISYVAQKANVDKLILSNILFQMNTAEYAIIKLLEQLECGNAAPRLFEVLAALQKSKMDIIKHLAQFMVVMENNYKSIKEDWNNKIISDIEKEASYVRELTEADESDANTLLDSGENTMKFRGTKNLVNFLRDNVTMEKIEQHE